MTFDPLGLKAKCKDKKPCDAAFPSDPTTRELTQLVYAEGDGEPRGDLAVASVVVNRAGYGNSGLFGSGISGVINFPNGFQANKNPLFNSVANADQVSSLDEDGCQRYKAALLAAIAAQQPGGTNTNALYFYHGQQPPYIKKGLKAGTIVPMSVESGSNTVSGPYGTTQYFYGLTHY